MLADSSLLLLTGARILLGGAFAFAGLRNLTNLGPLTQVMSARGVPFTQLVLYAGIALQLVAGLLLIAGVWTPFAAAALILFLLVATPMFNNFWDHEGLDRVNRINGAVANVGLAGGFLALLATAS